MKKNRLLVFGLIGFLCVGAVIFAGIQRNWFEGEPISAPELQTAKQETKSKRLVEHKPLSDALGVSEEDMVEIGGIKRPRRDLLEDEIDLVAARKEYQASVPNPGRAPYIDADTSPVVATLAKEVKEAIGQSPAKSTYYQAEPFDKAAYLKDPESYLSLTRPARVFQSAQPGADVNRIKSKTEFYQEILQGESVVLKVKAEPKMPISFHTQQLGEFENRLKTITVAASEDGIAKVTYKAGPGVAGLVNIMASSPTSSGQLIYMVNVNLPTN